MARFCSNCGAPLTGEPTNCPSCNAPVASATPVGPTASTGSSTGLSDNTAGALAYVTFIPALIFLLLEPYNRRRFVRFHAFQSLLFNLAYFVIHVALRFLPTIGWTLSSVVWFLAFVLWIVFVVKASQGQMWKAPIIGDIAEKQAGA